MFPTRMTEAVCNILGATGYPGLSNLELASAIGPTRLALAEGPNKRSRLLITLNNAQIEQQAGNVLVVFVNEAMHPSRYVDDHNRFAELQGQLNQVLALFGYRVNDEGRFARAQKASTLSEAARLAGELTSETTHPRLIAGAPSVGCRRLPRAAARALRAAARPRPLRGRRGHSTN